MSKFARHHYKMLELSHNLCILSCPTQRKYPSQNPSVDNFFIRIPRQRSRSNLCHHFRSRDSACLFSYVQTIPTWRETCSLSVFEEARVDLDLRLVTIPASQSHDLTSQLFKIAFTSAKAVSKMYCNGCYDEYLRHGWKAMSFSHQKLSWLGCCEMT